MMQVIDGSVGEGGGQILRTALALSLYCRRPFRLTNIRVRRRRPGLRPQHLAAIHAAAVLGQAEVEGAVEDSRDLVFVPRALAPGRYEFDVGTAGSATLVAQAVLPALVEAPGPSELVIRGGTHNPLAPPFEFLQNAFLPLLERMGPRMRCELVRPGFYPAGGGILRLQVEPVAGLRPLALIERGELLGLDAVAVVAHLPAHIAERELAVVERELAPLSVARAAQRWDAAAGPGNAVLVTVRSREITEVFSGIGQRGVPAETVAQGVVAQARQYLEVDAPVGPHLADQLLLPLVVAGGGAIVSGRPSSHVLTNIEVIQQFVNTSIAVESLDARRWQIGVTGSAGCAR